MQLLQPGTTTTGVEAGTPAHDDMAAFLAALDAFERATVALGNRVAWCRYEAMLAPPAAELEAHAWLPDLSGASFGPGVRQAA